jgi:hypothetical protein
MQKYNLLGRDKFLVWAAMCSLFFCNFLTPKIYLQMSTQQKKIQSNHSELTDAVLIILLVASYFIFINPLLIHLFS